MPDEAENLDARPPQAIEGQGDSLLDDHHIRQSAMLMRRAIRLGWNVPARTMEVVPAKMLEVVEDTVPVKPKSRKRRYRYRAETRIKAARTLIMMHGQNLTQDRDEGRVDGASRPAAASAAAAVNVEVNIEKETSQQVAQEAMTLLRQRLIHDQDFVDYQRNRIIERDAGDVRVSSDESQVPHGDALGGIGSGTNGHSNGAQ